ncbi:MAG: argininosuccinate synthase, partial [Elusimicrobia bacterium]|nr:argininosuccinate synthase [Elusimicrobiota bacterium]
WKMEEFLKQFRGRTDMLDYAARNGIEVKADRDKPYSEDENLLHISHEAGILEDPMGEPDESVFSRTVSPMNAPDRPERLAIQFKNGVPVKVKNLTDGATRTGALALFTYLNEAGGRNGIGRVDMVENRFVGIKSRGVYETPAGTILLAAHRDIEGMAMDREVMRLRDQFSDKFAELAYNGFWFSPEMDFLCAAIDKSQEYIDGTVYLTLYKGNVIITGRKSPRSLYNEKLSSMELAGGFNQKDSEGFIKIHAVRLSAHNAIVGRRRK